MSDVQLSRIRCNALVEFLGHSGDTEIAEELLWKLVADERSTHKDAVARMCRGHALLRILNHRLEEAGFPCHIDTCLPLPEEAIECLTASVVGLSLRRLTGLTANELLSLLKARTKRPHQHTVLVQLALDFVGLQCGMADQDFDRINLNWVR